MCLGSNLQAGHLTRYNYHLTRYNYASRLPRGAGACSHVAPAGAGSSYPSICMHVHVHGSLDIEAHTLILLSTLLVS